MAATYQPPQWLVPNMGPGNVNKVGNYSFDFYGSGDYIDCGSINETEGITTMSRQVIGMDT